MMKALFLLVCVLLVCCVAEDSEAKFKSFDVEFVTTVGKFTLHVVREAAPLGADRFRELLKLPNGGYFKQAGFFRVLPGFVVQFGIAGSPALSAAWRDKTIKDDPVIWSNTKGTLSYAAAGPNTRTTQVFINYANNAGLDGQGFAPFANVTSGMAVVEKIYSQYGQEPNQNEIYSQGDAYLKKDFPLLDYIISTNIHNEQY